MRRVVAIALVLAALAGLLVLAAGARDDDAYEVRAVFDSAGFLTEGADVRIAGAIVGSVSSVGLTGEGERARAEGSPEPGKAVVVLRIDDPGFRDFRADASCLIRPQSLLGEKFVECEPTRLRAAGSAAPRALQTIPEGEPGEGQRFLPLESNGKAVDLDLVQNIMREPFVDRFRLILNDLGAGLAARGEELAEIVRRSSPALRRTDEVLAILARQNGALARLARDGDRVLGPLARERGHVSGFIRNATAAAEAAAERRRDLEAGLERLPSTLGELRLTMAQLRRLAERAAPTVTDLRAAAPATTRATRALGPFARSATSALESLGDAAAASEDPLRASDSVVRDVRDLARAADSPGRDLRRLLSSLRRTGAFEDLLGFIFNSSGAINGFDQLGHYLRAFLLITNCNDYVLEPLSGCGANFPGAR